VYVTVMMIARHQGALLFVHHPMRTCWKIWDLYQYVDLFGSRTSMYFPLFTPLYLWFVPTKNSQPLIFTHTNYHQLSACTSNLPVFFILFNNKMYYTQILVLQVYVSIVVSLFQKYVFILEYNFICFIIYQSISLRTKQIIFSSVLIK